MTMLAALARAYDRMDAKPDFGFGWVEVGYCLVLDQDGELVGPPSDLRDGTGRRPVGRRMIVPTALEQRTSGIAANFLWDKSAYSLGLSATSKRADKEHLEFVRLHRQISGNSDDAGLLALSLFLGKWSPEAFAKRNWPQDLIDENIVFAFENTDGRHFVHDSEGAKAAWREFLAGQSGPEEVCLVSGEDGPIARSHFPIKGVRDAQSSGAFLVSYNADAYESYGHQQGLNAQVSEHAAFKYTTALNAFLAGTGNRVQIGDASTVFWADASAHVAAAVEDLFDRMVNSVDEQRQGGKVGAVLERIRQGMPWLDATGGLMPELAQGVRFFVLGLAPNAARISIRFWFEDDFGVLAENYRRYVEDMKILPAPSEPYPPLWRYLIETAVLGKRENVQPNLAGAWMRAILTGAPYPMTLLSAVLTRIRADGDVNALRVGMLRALLTRNFKMDKEAPVALDPENRNKGYLLGRLFALYENAQTAALGRNVNATIKDKFYASASASPRRVFSLLERGSVNHLGKLGKLRPGQRVNLEKAIGEIMGSMQPGGDPFPASLPAQDQALFGLGYYHQRNAQFSKSDNVDSGDASK